MTRSNKRIQEALDGECLSSSLRKSLRLAQEAKDSDLGRWCKLELDGYYSSNPAMGEDIVVPEYRAVAGRHVDTFGNVFVLPSDCSFIDELRLRNGTEELEAMARSRDVVAVHDPGQCEFIRRNLQVEVYSFRFSTVHLIGVLSSIRSELEERMRSRNLQDVPGQTRHDGQHQDIIQIRPNLYGIGFDVRALWRRWRDPK